MRIAIGCACVVVVGLGLGGWQRAAEACDPADSPQAMQPAPDQLDVPTNTSVWVRGQVQLVRLTSGEGAGQETIETTLHSAGAGSLTMVAVPNQRLKPSTRYQVLVAAANRTPANYAFTTGAGETTSLPAVPEMLSVRASRTKPDPIACGPQEAFTLEVSGDEVAGAALYLLEAATDVGGYGWLATSEHPSFTVTWPFLPELVRIKPINLAGQSPEDGIPFERLDADDLDEGGCSAVGASSPWLLALILSGQTVLARTRRRVRGCS